METISDPSDWSDTCLEVISSVDAALRCQICKEFFRTPMITECTHTFCSLCIRRCFNEDGQCPTCRNKGTAAKLRKNTVIEEVVEAFRLARPLTLQIAHSGNAIVQPLKKRKIEHEADPCNENKSRETHSRDYAATLPSQTDRYIDDEKVFSVSGLRPGHSRCPICNQEMRMELVFPHLDTHDPLKQTASTSAQHNMHNSIRYSHDSDKPLPNINYAIMNDRDLKKRLTNLGIPATGSKMLMQRRHTEYINMWNANCDSSTPKSKSQLLQELSHWERSLSNNSNNYIMEKDFDGKAWSVAHDDGFQDLIAQARRRPVSLARSEDQSNISEFNKVVDNSKDYHVEEKSRD